MSVLTKAKVLIYQLVKNHSKLLILLVLVIYQLVFGTSLTIYCNFFLDFRFLVTRSV